MLRTSLSVGPLAAALVLGSGQPLTCQAPEVLSLTAAPEGKEMTISITGASPDGHVLLAGYLSVADSGVEAEFYGQALEAIQYATSTSAEMTSALTGLGPLPGISIVEVVSGTSEMPTAAATPAVTEFAVECVSSGFGNATPTMTQQATEEGTLEWLATSNPGTPTSRIPWGLTGSEVPNQPNLINQEKLARWLVVHQYEAIGQPVSGPNAPQVDQIMKVATNLTELRLHLLPIEVLPGSSENAPPKLKVGRSFSIPFTPTGQPGGFWALNFPHPSGEFYVYPGTPAVPCAILLAEPLESQAMLANLQIPLQGGGYASDIQGVTNSPVLTFTIPGSATSGLFFVRNTATNTLVPLEGPTAPSLVASLNRIYLD